MTTAQSIITGALTTLGVKAEGQPLPAEYAQQGLTSLNELIDSWAIESLFAWSTTEYTGTANGSTVTIGPTGDVVTPFQPPRIEGAFTRLSNIDYPINLVNYLEFADIRLKSVVGPFPTIGYYDAVGTLFLYPVASGQEIHVSVYQRLSEFATLLTNYSLEPGTRRALRLSLAEELAAEFSVPLNPVTAQLAMRARRMLKRSNHTVPQLGSIADSGYDLYPPGFSGDNYDGAIDPT